MLANLIGDRFTTDQDSIQVKCLIMPYNDILAKITHHRTTIPFLLSPALFLIIIVEFIGFYDLFRIKFILILDHR